eukprot:363790-Chlamydomonas_euryale.AAC.32
MASPRQLPRLRTCVLCRQLIIYCGLDPNVAWSGPPPASTSDSGDGSCSISSAELLNVRSTNAPSSPARLAYGTSTYACSGSAEKDATASRDMIGGSSISSSPGRTSHRRPSAVSGSRSTCMPAARCRLALRT